MPDPPNRTRKRLYVETNWRLFASHENPNPHHSSTLPDSIVPLPVMCPLGLHIDRARNSIHICTFRFHTTSSVFMLGHFEGLTRLAFRVVLYSSLKAGFRFSAKAAMPSF